MEIDEGMLKKCRHLGYLANRYKKVKQGYYEDRGDPNLMASMIEGDIGRTLESLMPESEAKMKILELEKRNEKLSQQVAELNHERKRGGW